MEFKLLQWYKHLKTAAAVNAVRMGAENNSRRDLRKEG